ncbi:MAG: hypothetical protein KDA75_05485 [Planctomycetaceae bacterium]|nr:hypothetical protein [Planctomycetaceae bacterium]
MLSSTGPLAAAESPFKKLVDFLFDGAPQPAAVDLVLPDELVLGENAGAQFRPLINRMAARELYFVEKVCQPDEAQMQRLKAAVVKAAGDLAMDYAKAEHAGRAPYQWTAPRPFLANAIAAAAEGVLAPEALARYRQEVDAREQASQDAGQRMIVRVIDRRVTLHPDQYQPLLEAVARDWKTEEYHGTNYFQYEEYLQLPSAETLTPILDDRQEKALRQATNYGRIHFGWDQEFGFNGWNDNGIELEDLEDLTQPADPQDLPEDSPQQEVSDESETVPVENPKDPLAAEDPA